MASNKASYNAWARIVAQAWVDPEFKEQLLANPDTTLKENGFPISKKIKYKILEDTKDMKNIVFHSESSPFQYQYKEKTKYWTQLIHDIKTNPALKAELSAHPMEVLKKYRIPFPANQSLHFTVESANECYLVLPAPPEKEALTESEMDQVVGGGISLSSGFCTDTCST